MFKITHIQPNWTAETAVHNFIRSYKHKLTTTTKTKNKFFQCTLFRIFLKTTLPLQGEATELISFPIFLKTTQRGNRTHFFSYFLQNYPERQQNSRLFLFSSKLPGEATELTFFPIFLKTTRRGNRTHIFSYFPQNYPARQQNSRLFLFSSKLPGEATELKSFPIFLKTTRRGLFSYFPQNYPVRQWNACLFLFSSELPCRLRERQQNSRLVKDGVEVVLDDGGLALALAVPVRQEVHLDVGVCQPFAVTLRRLQVAGQHVNKHSKSPFERISK